MPIFQQSEYTDFSCRPGLDEAWERLPVVATFDGLGARWLGPLVDLGHEVWLGDLSQGAWGYLELSEVRSYVQGIAKRKGWKR